VNRLCASSLDAVNVAARMIEADHGDVMIAGGEEGTSRCLFLLTYPAVWLIIGV